MRRLDPVKRDGPIRLGGELGPLNTLGQRSHKSAARLAARGASGAASSPSHPALAQPILDREAGGNNEEAAGGVLAAGTTHGIWRDIREPDGRLRRLDLTEEWTNPGEFVMPPVLKQTSRLRGNLPLIRARKPAPSVHVAAHFVDDRGRVVLLLLRGKPLAFVENDFFLFGGTLYGSPPIFGRRNVSGRIKALATASVSGTVFLPDGLPESCDIFTRQRLQEINSPPRFSQNRRGICQARSAFNPALTNRSAQSPFVSCDLGENPTPKSSSRSLTSDLRGSLRFSSHSVLASSMAATARS